MIKTTTKKKQNNNKTTTKKTKQQYENKIRLFNVSENQRYS